MKLHKYCNTKAICCQTDSALSLTISDSITLTLPRPACTGIMQPVLCHKEDNQAMDRCPPSLLKQIHTAKIYSFRGERQYFCLDKDELYLSFK